MKVGQRVHLLHGDIPGYLVTTVAQIDEAADKVQIRFARPRGEGYSYLFWRDRRDVVEVPNGQESERDE